MLPHLKSRYKYLLMILIVICGIFGNFIFPGIVHAGLIIKASTSWKLLNSIPEARYESGIETYGDYVYVVGGNIAGALCNSGPTASIRTSIYYSKVGSDGRVGSWSTTSSLPTQRYGRQISMGSGYVYSVGG